MAKNKASKIVCIAFSLFLIVSTLCISSFALESDIQPYSVSNTRVDTLYTFDGSSLLDGLFYVTYEPSISIDIIDVGNSTIESINNVSRIWFSNNALTFRYTPFGSIDYIEVDVPYVDTVFRFHDVESTIGGNVTEFYSCLSIADLTLFRNNGSPFKITIPANSTVFFSPYTYSSNSDGYSWVGEFGDFVLKSSNPNYLYRFEGSGEVVYQISWITIDQYYEFTNIFFDYQSGFVEGSFAILPQTTDSSWILECTFGTYINNFFIVPYELSEHYIDYIYGDSLQEAYDRGYREGRRDGLAEGESGQWASLGEFLVVSIGAFMTAEIFPGFALASILSLVVGSLLLLFILHLLR